MSGPRLPSKLLAILIFGLVVTLHCFPLDIHAADVSNLELLIDGSAEPPGDKLNCSVTLQPSEPGLTLQIRLFEIVESPPADNPAPTPAQPSGPRKIIPVKGADAAKRDADGNVLLTVEVAANNENAAKQVVAEIVVPYASLDLAEGQHVVGYEIRGVRGPETVLCIASELSRVKIGKLPRTFRKIEYIRRNRLNLNQPAMQFSAVLAEALKTAPKPERLEEVKSVFRDHPLDIEIAGGFERDDYDPDRKTAPKVLWNSMEIATLSVAAAATDIAGITIPKDKPWKPLPDQTVYFATNRDVVLPTSTDATRFGDKVDAETHYGSCRVNIPVIRDEKNLLATGSGWWGSFDPQRDFHINVLNPLPEPALLQVLANALQDEKDGVLLFVHGFNVTFEYSVLRAAQMKHDIGFRGRACAFSWPSKGRTDSYKTDEASAAASYTPLMQLLKKLIEQQKQLNQPHGKIHILAHSMGNRVLLNAIDQLDDLSDGERPFGHVILAAPDVDIRTFVELVPEAALRSESLSLYFCSRDQALRVSQDIHFDSRAGQGPVYLRELINIDATRADTSWIGHAYYADEPRLLGDLKQLIQLGVKRPDDPLRSLRRQVVRRTRELFVFP